MKRKLIAITGKIGSGKSAVSRILREMGFKTVDCDDLAKQIADKPEVVEQVELLLGSKCVSNGKLNRKAIREMVFDDVNLLNKYQQIFFDGVKTLLIDTLATLQKEKVVFVEIPVLDAFPFDWDAIWRVESDGETCVKRVTARDNVSAESVFATLSSQKDYDCDYLIVNNGDLEQLRKSVHIILCENRLT